MAKRTAPSLKRSWTTSVYIEAIIYCSSEFEVNGHCQKAEFTLYNRRTMVPSEKIPEDVVTSKSNAGGDIWDWAQKNWPEWLDVDNYVVYFPDGFEWPTQVTWVCVCGVIDASNGKPLPIKEVNKYNKINKSMADAEHKKRNMTPSTEKVSSRKTASSNKSTSASKKSSKNGHLEEASSQESMTDEAIQKVLEE